MDTLQITKLTNYQLTIVAELIKAYNDVSRDYESLAIEYTGYNEKSGYVYLGLENGITICKADYSSGCVLYLVTDFESGEEFFYENYGEATDKLIESLESQLADF
jgi:hypothetical protein